jgi:hypothetical protein
MFVGVDHVGQRLDLGRHLQRIDAAHPHHLGQL